VAANGYIRKCYLCQMFKPITGRTFSEYVTQQRMIRARNLLLTTDDTVASIAENSGYRTAAYFSTAFKKETGMTPKAFRRTFSGAAPTG
ncbi:MAG TPA: helix-turn-helix transcriptional regulator, partial [Clostridia bacterium]|nr:helix-turn-helix transcriptional regulator [Clostridia bacterium]